MRQVAPRPFDLRWMGRRVDIKKIVGLISFFIAIGMLLMVVVNNRFIGLIMMALLLFVGYYCFTD